MREIFSRRRGDVFDSIRVLTFYSPSLSRISNHMFEVIDSLVVRTFLGRA